MQSDPFDIPGLEKAIRQSVRLQNDAFESRFSTDNLNLAGDKFSRSSPELLQLIATLLPTSDVRSIRLASSGFAIFNLPEKFWASRFKRGNEFDHIPEALHNPPESWKALYLSLKTWACDNPGVANRKRVWGLAKQLQSILSQMEGVHCNGSPLKTWFESPRAAKFCEDEGEISWRTAARGINAPEKNFRHSCRVLQARAFRFVQPLEVQRISVFLFTPQAARLCLVYYLFRKEANSMLSDTFPPPKCSDSISHRPTHPRMGACS